MVDGTERDPAMTVCGDILLPSLLAARQRSSIGIGRCVVGVRGRFNPVAMLVGVADRPTSCRREEGADRRPSVQASSTTKCALTQL